tara:strand:+ start:5378 stop:5746 length:369 start_codon:yes stop_codon:yes gene_type:complete
MEIINSEFRKNVLSLCCEKKVYLGTQDCSGCLKQCAFVIEKQIAFHKWLFEQSKGQSKPVEFLTELLRTLLIEDQNASAFQLLDMTDIGEQHFNRESLGRAAQMIYDTNCKLFFTKKNNKLN